MRHFFQKLDPWGNSLALWVVLAMGFLAPIAIFGLQNVKLENNIGDWLEPNNIQARKFRWLEEQFPHEDVVLASWDGSQLGDPRVEQFAEKLHGRMNANGDRRGGLEQIKSVRTPQQLLEQIEENAPDRGRAESLEQINGVLIGSGKLRVLLSETGQKRKEAAQRVIQEWAQSELGLNAAVLPAFQDKLLTDLQDASDEEKLDEMEATRHDFRVGWAGMKMGGEQAEAFQTGVLDLRFDDHAGDKKSEPIVEDCFFYPGTPVAIALFLTEAGMADKGGTVRAIRAAAEEVGIAPETLHLGGSPVAASALNQGVIKTVWNRNYPIWMLHERSVILLSGLVGVFLTFYLLRSLRLGILVLAVSYFTPLMVVSLVPVTGGSMNMVLIVMPTLLLMLTISGSIHVANYWKHAAVEDMKTAVVKAADMAREPCVLASLTTAIGLLSLSTSHLTPVRDFGFYSAIGMLISLVMVLYALPSFLHFWPAKKPDPEEIHHGRWETLAAWLADHHTVVTCTFLVICAGSTAGLTYFQTETKVIKYFEESSQVYRDYAFLEENLSGIVPVQVVVKFEGDNREGPNFAQRADLVRAIQEKIQQIPDISGTLSLANFLPVREPLAEDATRLQILGYNSRAKTMEDRVKGDENGRAKSYLVMAQGDSDFSKSGDELWRITAQVAILTDLDYSQLTEQLDQVAAETLRLEPSAGHVVTGMVPLFLETQNEVLSSLIRSFCLAFGVIAIVLMVVLKHPLAGFFAMLPNVLPIGMVFGMISWFRIPVDIGTMITASVALGIAVDGTLHLLTWFRNGILEGMSRKQALARALGHCGPAMLQTSMVTSLGLIVLYPAELLLISRFGWLMASLIGMALVADIILLPALLAGPLGVFIERRTLKAQSSVAHSSGIVTPEPHLNATATTINRQGD